MVKQDTPGPLATLISYVLEDSPRLFIDHAWISPQPPVLITQGEEDTKASREAIRTEIEFLEKHL